MTNGLVFYRKSCFTTVISKTIAIALPASHPITIVATSRVQSSVSVLAIAILYDGDRQHADPSI